MEDKLLVPLVPGTNVHRTAARVCTVTNIDGNDEKADEPMDSEWGVDK